MRPARCPALPGLLLLALCACRPSLPPYVECEDGPCDGTSTRALLVPTGPLEEEFTSPHSEHTFIFEALADHTYLFTCTAEGFSACDVHAPALQEYNEGTSFVERDGATTRWVIRPRFTLALRMSVSALPEGAQGRYSFSLAERVDDHGAGASDATPIAVSGVPVEGRLDFGPDTDAFSFDAEAGHLYGLRCEGDFPPGTTLTLRDPGGQEVQAPGTLERLVELPVPGRFTLQLSASASPSSVPYRCSVTDRGPEDHGDTAATATPLPDVADVQATGELEVLRDKDFFSFPARAGHAYTLNCAPETSAICGEIALVNAQGYGISGWPAGVAQDTTLYVRVGTFMGDVTGPYTFTLRDLGADQGTGPDDAVAVTLDAALEGFLTPYGDVDFFRFEAEPGHVYRVDAGNAPVEAVRWADPTQSLTHHDRTSPGKLFMVDAAEPVLVSVSGSQGAYTLRITDVGMDDHAGVPEAATVLGSTLVAEGRLDASTDVDWFAVDLEARAYAVHTVAVDTKFLLLHPDGQTPVAWDQTTSSYVPPSAGRYLVRAEMFGYFSAQDAYRFELTPR